MRALYLFLIVVFALTAALAFMGATANGFEWYEFQSEQKRLAQNSERVTARIIDKRVVRHEYRAPPGPPRIEEQRRLYVEIQEGARAGEVVWETAKPPQYQQLEIGTEVDLLVGDDEVHIIDLGYYVGTPTWAFLGIAVVSVLACAGLGYRIRRMPAGR